jgi:hypothetical protein
MRSAKQRPHPEGGDFAASRRMRAPVRTLDPHVGLLLTTPITALVKRKDHVEKEPAVLRSEEDSISQWPQCEPNLNSVARCGSHCTRHSFII